MAKFRTKGLEQAKPFKTRNGETIRLIVRPLKRIDKIYFIECQARGEMAEAERSLLANCVTGWEAVEDDDERPILFNFAVLNVILGADDVLGKAVSDYLLDANGLGMLLGGEKRDEETGRRGGGEMKDSFPLDGAPVSGSSSSSNAGSPAS